MQHVVIIKTLLYTGVRVSELVRIKISDIDLDSCQIRVTQVKGKKDRIVPFPNSFMETLAMHIENGKKNKTIYLFESSWKKPYSDRGIRKILMNYTKEAGIENSISPHKLRQFLFTWMKKKGVDDALIQPYSGHESRQSLEIYSKLSLADCQPEYEKKIKEGTISMKQKKLLKYILIAMISGILIGKRHDIGNFYVCLGGGLVVNANGAGLDRKSVV